MAAMAAAEAKAAAQAAAQAELDAKRRSDSGDAKLRALATGFAQREARMMRANSSDSATRGHVNVHLSLSPLSQVAVVLRVGFAADATEVLPAPPKTAPPRPPITAAGPGVVAGNFFEADDPLSSPDLTGFEADDPLSSPDLAGFDAEDPLSSPHVPSMPEPPPPAADLVPDLAGHADEDAVVVDEGGLDGEEGLSVRRPDSRQLGPDGSTAGASFSGRWAAGTAGETVLTSAAKTAAELLEITAARAKEVAPSASAVAANVAATVVDTVSTAVAAIDSAQVAEAAAASVDGVMEATMNGMNTMAEGLQAASATAGPVAAEAVTAAHEWWRYGQSLWRGESAERESEPPR